MKKNVLQFDIGFIYAKSLHIVSVSQIQPGTYFVDKVLFQQAALVLCILSLLLHTIIVLAYKFLSQVTRFFQETICSYHLVSTAQGLGHSTGSLPSTGAVTTAKTAVFLRVPSQGEVAKLQQSLWSENLKVLLSGPLQKKCADPRCRQRCRRHVLSVQTHMQNLIYWQRAITKTNKGRSSKLLKQLRIIAWVSSGRNSGIYFFFKKKTIHLQDLLCIIETLYHLTNTSPFLPPTGSWQSSFYSLLLCVW